MNTAIQSALDTALDSLKQQGLLPQDFQNNSSLSRTRDRSHGDFASNVAMIAAKAAGQKPRDLAEKILAALPQVEVIRKAEIAGPGFINFFLNDDQRFAVLDQILSQAQQFGRSQQFAGHKAQVEFVSANPTSSLHVGHGRGAAYGMTVANLLEAVGWQVQREYYVNDAGRQMDILATSTFLRYLELCGQSLTFPSNGYRGAYVTDDIARKIFEQYGNQFNRPVSELFANVPSDALYADALDKDGNKVLLSGDKEKHIDGLIANAQQLLGNAHYRIFHQTALQVILDDIKDDLADFGVTFDQWFSEATLQDEIDKALALLQQNGFLYEQNGNIWFKSTSFGDEKDRVVKRANGQTTYFAADIAYHLNKFQRGFDQVINIWGSDHHGYISRVKAAIDALGFDSKKLTVLLVQFVSLWRGSEMVQMSSRSGQFVSLRELRAEVGNDAARFYYVMRKSEQHIDFDLNLAVSQSKDNAVYYIQYANARINRLFANFSTQLGAVDINELANYKAHLNSEAENELLTKLAAYPEVIARAAQQYEPHQVGNYLKELAGQLHGWYDTHPLIKLFGENPELVKARLLLAYCVQQVLKNGLSLLGVSAPETM